MSTLNAKKKCAEFLVSCKQAGWSDAYIGKLEALWLAQHDEHGNLVIHDKVHEPMFTETQVRAMVDEMTMHIDIPVRCIALLRKIASKHIKLT